MSGSSTYSQEYIITPAANVKTVVTVNPTATLHQNIKGVLTKVDSVSAGTVGGTTAATVSFYVKNEGGNANFGEGQVAVEYTGNEKAYVNVNFYLSKSGTTDEPATVWSKADGQHKFNDSIVNHHPSAPKYIGVAMPVGASSGIAAKYAPLREAMVFLVDKNRNGSKNMLFRGNCPLAAPTVSDGPQSVSFDNVHEYMKSQYENQTGKTNFPKKGDYIFSDICLQNPTSEGGSILSELQSFGDTSAKMSDLDRNVWYPTSGPASVDGHLVQMSLWSIQNNKDAYSLNTLLANNLSDWMNKSDTTPRIYYIHCASGVDRTGLSASTYFATNHTSLTLLESFIYGTTVNKQPGDSAGGKQVDCQDLNVITAQTDPDRSRYLPGGSAPNDSYDAAVVDVWNNVRKPATKVTDLPSNSGIVSDLPDSNTCYVYDNYPWAD